mgnify:CR=1 FL=1
MTRVIQLIRGLDIGGEHGGAELFGVRLAQQLRRLPDLEVSVVGFYKLGTETERAWLEILNNQGLQTELLTSWEGNMDLGSFHKATSKLNKLVKNSGAQVIHSHFHLGSLASAWLKIRGLTRASVRTAHNHDEWSDNRLSWLLKPFFINQIFPRVLDTEAGVSEAVVNYLKSRSMYSRNHPEKFPLIYNGIAVEEIQSFARDVTPAGTCKMVTNGRLDRQKGYPYLIQALELYNQGQSSWQMEIIGEGVEREALEQQVAKAGLADKVSFAGTMPHAEAIRRVAAAHLFVLASLWEGLPTSVLEAMALGVPVVATDIPGTRELISTGNTGRLVPAKDPQALAEAIRAVFAEKEKTKLMAVNAKAAATKFDFTEIAKAYTAIYFNLLRNN